MVPGLPGTGHQPPMKPRSILTRWRARAHEEQELQRFLASRREELAVRRRQRDALAALEDALHAFFGAGGTTRELLEHLTSIQRRS